MVRLWMRVALWAVRTVFAAMLVLCCSASLAWAATRLWDAGGGATITASTGANWCNITTNTNDNTAPASGDTIQFGGTGTSNCTPSNGASGVTWDILNGYSVAAWTMNSTGTAFTGTITLGVALSVTNALTINSGTLTTSGTNYSVTAGSYSQAGGALTANGSTITSKDNWSQTAGTFTAGTSTVVLDGSTDAAADLSASSTLNNLTIGTSATGVVTIRLTSSVTVGGTLTVQVNDVLQQDGTARTVTLSAASTPLSMQSGSSLGTGSAMVSTVNYTGTSATTVTGTTYNNLGVGTTADSNIVTYTLGGNTTANGTVTIGQATTNAIDTLTTSASNYSLTAGAITIALYGALTANNSTITLTNTSGTPLTVTGTLTETTGTTIKYTAASGTVTVTARTYTGHLTINGGSAAIFNAGGALVVNGTMTVTSGTFSGNTNNVTLKGTVGAGGVCLNLNGANGVYATSASGQHSFGDNGADSVTISAGTLRMEAPDESSATYFVKYSGLAWTNSGGTVLYEAPASSTPKVLTTIDPYYDLTIGAGNANSYTYSSASAITVNNNLTIAANSTLTLGASSTVNGNVSVSGTLALGIKNLDINGGSLTGAGSISNAGGGAVTLTGTGNLGTTGGAYAFYDLNIGTGTTAAATTVQAGQTPDITVSHQLTITGKTGSPFNSLNGGQATFRLSKVSGNTGTGRPFYFGANASFTPASSTVIYQNQTGGTDLANLPSGSSFNNLTLTPAAAVTYDVTIDLIVAGTVTVNTNATLNAASFILTLSGSGTPLDMGGADRLTEGTSTIAYTNATSATILATTYNNLRTNGAGTYSVGGTTNVSATLQVSSGTLSLSSYDLAASTVTIDGGTLQIGSAGKLKVGSVLNMTNGKLLTTDVATAPIITTGGFEGSNFYGVNFSGGELDVGELDFRSVSATTVNSLSGYIHIGSGVTVTNFNKVSLGTTGASPPNFHGGSIGQDALLNVTRTSGTFSMSNLTFPNSAVGECNIRANTSGTITVNSFTGAFGGTPNECENGGVINWPGLIFSGTVYSDEGTTPITGTPTVRIKVNGAGDYSATATSGAYTISSIQAASGAVVTAYLDTAGVGPYATTVTRSADANITGLNLYQNRVILRHEDAGPVTNTNLGQYDKDNDPDIHFTSNAGTLTVDNDTELHIVSGKTLTPGGAVVLSTGGSDPGGDLHVIGTLSMEGNNLTVGGGDITGAGIITQTASGTTTVKGTSTTGVGGGTYTFFNLTIGDGSTSSTVALAGTVTVSNDVDIPTSSGTNKLLLAGQALTVSGGDFTNAETVNCGTIGAEGTCSAGTVTMAGTGSIGGAGTTTFYNLTVGTSTSAITTTAGGDLTVKGALTVDTTVGNLDTFYGSSRTITLAGTGTPFVMGSPTQDRFTEGTSIVVYTNGTSATVTTTTYNHLWFNGAGTYTLPSGTLTTNGGICITAGTVKADTNDPNIAVGGDFPFCAAFGIAAASGASYTKGAAGTITLNGGTVLRDDSTTKSDFGAVIINAAISTYGSVTATSVEIKDGKSLNISDDTLTLTGSNGTNPPLYLNATGTLTDNPSSTVEFQGTGTTTVNARTYAGNLKINGSGGTFNAGGAIIVNGNVTVSAGTLAMGANNLTVGTGTASSGQSIVGAGAISQSASATTTLKGTGNLGGTAATGACAGTNGSFQFYNLMVGDNANAKTTTACGAITVSGVFTIAGGTANQIFDGGTAGAVTLSGSGTPFVINGTFTPNTGAVTYASSSGATVTGTTYYTLRVTPATASSAVTYTLGGDIIVNGTAANALTITGANFQLSVLDTSANNYNITLGSGGLNLGNASAYGQLGKLITNNSAISTVGLTLNGGTITQGSSSITTSWLDIRAQYNAWTPGSGTLTLNGTAVADTCATAGVWCDAQGVDVGAVIIDGSVRSSTNVKATSLTINSGRLLSISDDTLTLTGTGAVLSIAGGMLLDNANSTVEYAAPSGSATVYARTYGGQLTISGGGVFNTGGSLTASGLLTVSAGTFRVGTNHTVMANNGVTINGGSFSMPNSGGVLDVTGTLTMSSGSLVTSDVATAPSLGGSTYPASHYAAVNITGGTLDVAELNVNYLNAAGFVINPSVSVTVTAFDKVTWGENEQTSGGTDVILDVTALTASFKNHTFPSSSSKECNVRSNTSGVVTMWDWSGGFGGENNDCDSGGEVVWQGGSGSPHGGSGNSGYPAIY